jgi:hypothetical protein
MKVTAFALCFSLISAPVFVDSARAATHAKELAITASVATSRADDTSIGSRAGSFFIEDVADRRITHGRLVHDDRSASFSFAGDTLTLDDGYAIENRTLTNNSSQLVKQLIALSPEGTRETATIRYDYRTGNAATQQLDRVRALLGRSQSFSIIAAVLPVLLAAHKSESQTVTTMSETDWVDCLILVAEYVAATVALILACGVPEPVMPIVCAAAVLAFAATGLAVGETCGTIEV